MKTFAFLIAVGLITTSFNCDDSSAKTSLVNNSTNGFAVIELFTSEGCSSCPSADNAVAKLLKEHNSNVYVLSYHVDYWDNLGWKDMFSSAAYTQLQKEYAKAFKLASIYTPQIVVNGTEQFVGSDENKIKATVNKDLQQPTDQNLNIEAKTNDNKTVHVSYNTNATNVKLKIVLIQLSADNKIQRGENSGATLHHVNIVRDIQTLSAANGNIVLKIPVGLAAKDCRIIAFTQNKTDNKITSATEVNIQ